MEDNFTFFYEPPVAEVIDLNTEGIIGGSGFDGFGGEEIW